MKNIVSYSLIIYLSIGFLAAQTSKTTNDDDDTRLILPTYTAKDITSTKPIKTGGQASTPTTDLAETAKTVKTFLNNTNKNVEREAVQENTNPENITNLNPAMTTTETKKDLNAIEFHETFRPEIFDTNLDVASDSLYVNPEIPATFVGGPLAMKKFIEENIHVPQLDKKESAKGRVFISFIVNKEGGIEQIRMIKGLKEEYNNEALKVIRKMPSWQPARHNGKSVKSFFSLPIAFVN